MYVRIKHTTMWTGESATYPVRAVTTCGLSLRVAWVVPRVLEWRRWVSLQLIRLSRGVGPSSLAPPSTLSSFNLADIFSGSLPFSSNYYTWQFYREYINIRKGCILVVTLDEDESFSAKSQLVTLNCQRRSPLRYRRPKCRMLGSSKPI